MKEAWTQDSVAVAVSGSTHTMRPRPVQKPHPPIWMGGNSRRAMRRAVELGDGWDPFANPATRAAVNRTPGLDTLEKLTSRLEELHELEAQLGRSVKDVMFSPLGAGSYGRDDWDAAAFHQITDRYESLGVTMTLVHIPAHGRNDYGDLLASFGSDVLQKTPAG
jgi:alkanesulfonate monooxygenase SsuD/methylene tetrahydromethanopterin reductase-like flavin-dependent oxidoreductase (luciferase family)